MELVKEKVITAGNDNRTYYLDNDNARCTVITALEGLPWNPTKYPITKRGILR